MEYRALTAAQRKIYDETVAGSHHRRIKAKLLDLDGKVKRDLTPDYLGGSLQGDTSRAPVEVFEATILDTEGRIDWTNGKHRHYQLRVIDGRFIPGIAAHGAWVEQVGFEGPLWDFTRTGETVQIIAHSGERLAMGSVRNVFTRPRKARASSVVRDLLEAAGAKKKQVKVPKLKAKLPKSVTIGIRRGKDIDPDKPGKQQRVVRKLQSNPWEDTYFGTAQRIAEALDRQLYWEPGRFIMARPESKASWKIPEGIMLAPVEERRGEEGETPNTWLIVGHKRPKGKGRRHAKVSLPKSHAASSSKMAWNNTPRNVTVRVENDNLRTNKACRQLGLRLRKKAMSEQMVYQAQMIPTRARLRPNALVTVPTTSGRAKVRVTQWTIPYSAGADAMTIGANRRRR